MQEKSKKFSGWTKLYFVILLLYPIITVINLFQLYEGTTLDEFNYLPLAAYYIIFTIMYVFLAVFAYYTLFNMYKRKKNAHILNYKFIGITVLLSLTSVFSSILSLI